MQLLVAEAVATLQGAWGCDVVVHRSHPVVTVAENYELLRYPADAAARDARYTRYITPATVLRTHATAMVPAGLRSIASADYEDVLLVCPGLVYRRDRIDRQSVGEPHQMDLWRIRQGRLGAGDLKEMIALLMHALLPEHRYRELATSHPYTTGGLEIEAGGPERWVEVAECGLAGPAILEEAGLPSGLWSGLAAGIGLDRVLMLRKGIDDIRLLRSEDERVVSQMRDLEPYRPVSSMPAVRRDLSVAVGVQVSAEELGDRVRAALGPAVDAVEAVALLSETPLGALPAEAAARLGIREGQKNVLVRVVLRHPTRTLTAGEANQLRDRVYAAIHEGSAHQWAARPG
jgi:phenylalanyl-tRNA synthetase alpha chain